MASKNIDFEDRVVIALPEGIEQELILAGLGSRIIAATIDMLVRFLAIIAYTILASAIAAWFPASEGYVSATWLALLFLISFGYDVVFETWGGGRTPGKRCIGIRVVREGGFPVGFKASAIRNLLRIVDSLPAGYLVGAVMIVSDTKNQRIGDRVANTLVVRDHKAPAARPTFSAGNNSAPGWDVSTISADELVLVRQFLERRHGLAPEARHRLAWQLAESLRNKVGGAPTDLPPEALLEGLAAAKVARL